MIIFGLEFRDEIAYNENGSGALGNEKSITDSSLPLLMPRQRGKSIRIIICIAKFAASASSGHFIGAPRWRRTMTLIHKHGLQLHGLLPRDSWPCISCINNALFSAYTSCWRIWLFRNMIAAILFRDVHRVFVQIDRRFSNFEDIEASIFSTWRPLITHRNGAAAINLDRSLFGTTVRECGLGRFSRRQSDNAPGLPFIILHV